MTTISDTTTLEYYQLIYTHCKQRFNIPDRIEVVKKSVYQYIKNCINNYLFENYNISKVRSNLYNNLVHYSQLKTEDLNSETLAIYFQELNFSIIQYCEEKYPVQFRYFIDFELKTETSNRGKQKLKQHSSTTSTIPKTPKITAKHLQTPEQGTSTRLLLLLSKSPTQQQELISTSINIIDYLQKNESNHSENLESEKTESEQEKTTENEEEMATAYIAKIPEFTARMLKTISYFFQGTAKEWFENLEELFENWQAFKDAFLQQFTDNNTSITLQNCFHNIKQETFETFIAGLKDKLIKKVYLHAPEDLVTAIRHTKNYKMAIEETNYTKLQQYQQFPPIQQYQPLTQQYQVPAQKLVQHNQFTPQNQFQNNNNRINLNNQLVSRNSGQQRPNYYHIQSSYLIMLEGLDFQQTTLSKGEVAVPRLNPSNHTIPPAQIAQNANLLDIFPFEFEANELPFLLSNAAVNEQKTITAMYTETEVKEKPIRLILDSRSARSIITYQLMQQLQKTVDRPAQTANANLDWKTQELKISYQGQYTRVFAICGTFNKKTEKAPVFKFEEEKKLPVTETFMALGLPSNWNIVRYSTPESQKQLLYIPLKCKDCNKKLLSIGACISPKEEYETHTCYFCKAYNTLCFTCGDMLPEECNWIDVAIRGRVCDQTCQYALSISEKVKKETPFDAAYNSAFNKLYHYSHNAEMIFDLAMALINRATQEDVQQIKEAEYIEYTIELTGFNYKDEQMNIQLCEECIMSCNDKWCPECYALNISLPSENDQEEIEFGKLETKEKITTTPIYFTENQPAIQFKYFDNNEQGIKLEKAHEIDVGYDFRYLNKTLCKKINVKRKIIDAGYTGDITVMLQNKTEKPFKIEHAKKIAQAIYLLLINILGLQSVKNRKQLGKSERGTQGFGSTGRFTMPVNIALNAQNKSYQILQLL
ncbi:hypothetical protein G9A89_002422 [Geosiphon pyriformis]|nr:hypothetical protein G9A89_002422 [Geosiphon pyriformis]